MYIRIHEKIKMVARVIYSQMSTVRFNVFYSIFTALFSVSCYITLEPQVSIYLDGDVIY